MQPGQGIERRGRASSTPVQPRRKTQWLSPTFGCVQAPTLASDAPQLARRSPSCTTLLQKPFLPFPRRGDHASCLVAHTRSRAAECARGWDFSEAPRAKARRRRVAVVRTGCVRRTIGTGARPASSLRPLSPRLGCQVCDTGRHDFPLFARRIGEGRSEGAHGAEQTRLTVLGD